MVELKGIAMAMLVVAGIGALQLPMPGSSKLGNGTDQTYWWCEMHHAPQNIQGLTVGGAISSALFGPPALPPNARKDNIIDGNAAKGPISASTPMVMFKRPVGNFGDPQEATFWCEMHATGASHLTQKKDAQESIKKAVGN
mmetsp:Transcript_58195/g.142766  ORF Transcript_58195/g.142766 Transcript_58195/m.142766 type:complete len:141 (-) Transcript_58195:242-664(-)